LYENINLIKPTILYYILYQKMCSISELKTLLIHCFVEYESWLRANTWHGKEHDCVNLFVHKFLFSRISPTGPIVDATQIGIETGVPQAPGLGLTKAVRKDLVIWPRPEMTTWDREFNAVHYPLAIIEWKARRNKSPKPLIFPYDLDWITKYSSHREDFIGCCATVDFTSDTVRLETALAEAGKVTENFHK
jgi:hypothetical protein